MSKSILVISYYSNMPGACQAEWIDDRMCGFIDKGYNISLVSATCCFKHTNSKIEHIRAPCLSPHGARYEYEEIKKRNIPFKTGIVCGYLKLMTFIDKLLNKLNITSGEGRWSWFISSTILSFFFKSLKDKEFIFTTGGPASAHLTGILLGKIYGKKVICELQDPLSGTDIGRNQLSQRGLKFFERLIIKYSDCTIYCTGNAMKEARIKYSDYTHKIFHVYPGANIIEQNIKTEENGVKKINMVYLGSLYQTRNLDLTMKAIEEIQSEDPSFINSFEINLYGNLNADIKARIENFQYKIIHFHGLVTREEAMQKALNADVLLLIQNTDDRSIATIPFKTYDYLHTGRLILALLYKNKELEKMMLEHGHVVCQANDIQEIKNNLKKTINHFSDLTSGIKLSKLTPKNAVEEMLVLVDGILFKVS